MKTALAIFAKTAELSPVKTRLAAAIGEEKAKAFYAHSVKAVEAIAQSAAQDNENIHPHWCVGEEAGIDYPQWQNFPAIWTGSGGLGERLATISETLFASHEAVIFIGTDSPQILPDVFQKTIGILERNPEFCIIGPAKDGGFYLFASRRPIPREIWEAVKYSVNTTLIDLTSRLQKNAIKTNMIEIEQDVDTLSDLKTLKRVLENKKPGVLPAQVKLLDWLYYAEKI